MRKHVVAVTEIIHFTNQVCTPWFAAFLLVCVLWNIRQTQCGGRCRLEPCRHICEARLGTSPLRLIGLEASQFSRTDMMILPRIRIWRRLFWQATTVRHNISVMQVARSGKRVVKQNKIYFLRASMRKSCTRNPQIPWFPHRDEQNRMFWRSVIKLDFGDRAKLIYACSVLVTAETSCSRWTANSPFCYSCFCFFLEHPAF